MNETISFFLSVGATGFEPTTPWSQTRYSTGLNYTPKAFIFSKAVAKLRYLLQTTKYFSDYFIILNSLNTCFSICTPFSTCSSVWVAISAKRTRVSSGAHAGGTTEFMNTPSSAAL